MLHRCGWLRCRIPRLVPLHSLACNPPILVFFGFLTPPVCRSCLSPPPALTRQVKLVTFAVLVAAASAFAPAPFGARHAATRLFSDVGKYDGKLWDNDGTSADMTSHVSVASALPDRALTILVSSPLLLPPLPSAAKKDVYNSWNPSAPRSPLNFNPFETFEGNSPDASGYYPGEVCYAAAAADDVCANMQVPHLLPPASRFRFAQ